jgi:hypothetical protein
MPLHSSVGSYLLGVLVEFAMDDAAVKAHESTVPAKESSCLAAYALKPPVTMRMRLAEAISDNSVCQLLHQRLIARRA